MVKSLEEQKLIKAYEIIANMGNQATEMRKSLELLLSEMPRDVLFKNLAELHDRRLREKRGC